MSRSKYDDFVIKEKIGSGSYGIVYKVIRKVDKLPYAMKEIDLQGMSRREQEECIRETRVLSSLDSDFIIKYYDSFLEKGRLYIITEYASKGNLHDYIKKAQQKLDEGDIWRLFIQILLGLNHMHSKKILHRDIKTLNVFLDEHMNVKLGDMGVAKILSTQTNFAKTIVGTPYYLSPELCEDKPYNEKSDVWALGVVLYECCTQHHPFDADNQGALILKILRGKYPSVTGYSEDLVDVIKRCLTQAAARRPDTFKLLQLKSVREKAQDLGILLPDSVDIQHAAVKAKTAKVPTGDMDQPPQFASEANHNEDLASTIKAQPVAGAAAAGHAPAQPAGVQGQMAGLHVGDEEEGEEDGENPYLKPELATDDEQEEDGEDGEEEDDDDGDYDDDDDGSWNPNSTRAKAMKQAAMIQHAACMDMIGEKAFNELYALLKSNQVDEQSMTDLSRHVFKIIPYDKSEVIQMMYKLLYLESQLN